MTARAAWKEDFAEYQRMAADMLPDEFEHKRAALLQAVNDWMADNIDNWDGWPESE